jgi:hypothetical protein
VLGAVPWEPSPTTLTSKHLASHILPSIPVADDASVVGTFLVGSCLFTFYAAMPRPGVSAVVLLVFVLLTIVFVLITINNYRTNPTFIRWAATLESHRRSSLVRIVCQRHQLDIQQDHHPGDPTSEITLDACPSLGQEWPLATSGQPSTRAWPARDDASASRVK